MKIKTIIQTGMKKFVYMVFAIFLTGCNSKQHETQEKIIPVKVMEVAATQVASEQNYVGTVEESIAVSLSFSGVGTVEQAFVSEGQKVAKGQLLATLNAATAQNAYDATLATQAQAQDAYDRLKKVHDNGSLPDIKFVEVETALQQAKSMVAISKKSLDDCRLYAPRSGVIAARNIEIGASVLPGVTAFKLVAVDKVNIKIAVPESEISGIAEEQTAKILVPALDNAAYTGKIEQKGVTANTLSHTYEVKIGINNINLRLMPGMVCKVSVADVGAKAEIVVPNRVVRVSHDGKHFVWLAESNNTVSRRFVTPGNLTDYGVVITEGLSAGDQIVVEGYTKISEGMKISIAN
jgi:RND family efflux transporter MFP subunit